jgi:DNA-directed RNA polymerase subunit H (RpoH/RPB5)
MTPSKSPARTSKKSSSRSKKEEAKSEAPPVEKLPLVQHAIVPTHEVLSAEESQKVLGTLGTPLERLPKILYDDPGLQTDPKYRALGEGSEGTRTLVGRLVRVRRPSPTAGEAIVYRVVVGGAAARED